MKILVTSQSSAMGGVERRLESEAGILKDLGWDVVFASPQFPGSDSWKTRIERSGCSFVRWNPYKFIERGHAVLSASLPFKPSRLALRKLKPDLAHVAMPWTTVGMSRVAEMQKMGIPVTLGLHCTYPIERLSTRISSQVQKALTGVISAYAVSDSVRQSFLKNFGGFCKHFDIEIIHNGIECDAYAHERVDSSVTRESLGVSRNDFLIVFCGRLDSMKRPDMAIRAMSHETLKPITNMKMLFIGEGPMRKCLEALAEELDISDRVVFLGFRKTPSDIYGLADCYISTSDNSEGFPLAVSEALASGLPSLLPDSPVFAECFRECNASIFFDANSIKDCAKAILNLYKKPAEELNGLGTFARDYARDKLDVSIMDQKLRLFYQKTANRLLNHG